MDKQQKKKDDRNWLVAWVEDNLMDGKNYVDHQKDKLKKKKK